MKRRSKDKEKDAPAAQDSGDSEGASLTGQPTPTAGGADTDFERLVKDKLAPVEESLQKSDQWMKETSAQLAKISSHVQQDEKRQDVLNDRLSGFEERLQSMLTLTEVLSMGENPFVKKGRSPPETTGDEEEDEEEHEDRPGLHKRKDGVVVVEAGDDLPPPRRRSMRDKRQSERPQRSSGDEDGGRERREAEIDEKALLALEAANPFFGDDDEDDDWDDDPIASAPAPAAAPEAPPAGHPFAAPSSSGDPVRDTEKRLVLLQWAALIAKHMHRLDVDEFLETYLHTEWVSQYDVKNVRALASDLTKHNDGQRGGLGREEIHLRTILLLSRLAGAPHPSHTAGATHDLVTETRRIAKGAWATDARPAAPARPPLSTRGPHGHADDPPGEAASPSRRAGQGVFPEPPVSMDRPIGHARRASHPNEAQRAGEADDASNGETDPTDTDAADLGRHRRSYRVTGPDDSGGAS